MYNIEVSYHGKKTKKAKTKAEKAATALTMDIGDCVLCKLSWYVENGDPKIFRATVLSVNLDEK